MQFHQRLKKIREEADFTQEEVAAKLHVAPQTVEEWENGNKVPSIKHFYDLSKLFSVSPYVIIGIGEPPEPTVFHPETLAMMKAQGTRLAAARTDRGMSVQEVAAAIGLSEEEYMALEAGTQERYEVDTLPRLAELFGISQNYIFFGTDNPPRCR